MPAPKKPADLVRNKPLRVSFNTKEHARNRELAWRMRCSMAEMIRKAVDQFERSIDDGK